MTRVVEGLRWCPRLVDLVSENFQEQTQHHPPHCVFCAPCACEAAESMQVDNSMPQKFFFVVSGPASGLQVRRLRRNQ